MVTVNRKSVGLFTGCGSGGGVCTHPEHVCWCSGCGLIATSNKPTPAAWKPGVCCSHAYSSQQRDSVLRNKVSTCDPHTPSQTEHSLCRPGRCLTMVRSMVERQLLLWCGARRNLYCHYQCPLLAHLSPPLFNRNMERGPGDTGLGPGQLSLRSLWPVTLMTPLSTSTYP